MFLIVIAKFFILLTLVRASTRDMPKEHFDYSNPEFPTDEPLHDEVEYSYRKEHENSEIHDMNVVRINKIEIPVPQPYPVPFEKKVPVPVKVFIKRPVPIEVPQPYPVIIMKRVPVIVKRPVPYTVRIPVQVPIYQRVEIPIPKPYPVPLRRPVTVSVPKPIVIESQVPIVIGPNHDDINKVNTVDDSYVNHKIHQDVSHQDKVSYETLKNKLSLSHYFKDHNSGEHHPNNKLLPFVI